MYNYYECVYEHLCEQVRCGNLTLEEANDVNDIAYEKYLKEETDHNNESSDDEKLKKQKRAERKKTVKHIITGAAIGAGAIALSGYGSKKAGNNLKKTNNSLVSANKTQAQNITKDVYVNKSLININQKKMNRNGVSKRTPVGNPKKISNNMDTHKVIKNKLPQGNSRKKINGPSSKTMKINNETYNIYERKPVLMNKRTKKEISQSKVLQPIMKLGKLEDDIIRRKPIKKKPIKKKPIKRK